MRWQPSAWLRRPGARYSMTPLERRKLLAAELRQLRSSSARNQADKLKALAEADKAATSSWKERAETLRMAIVGLSLLYGIVALFCYCFFIAKFIPSGVSAGDTLLFSFLALALGVIGIVLASAGAMMWLPITAQLAGSKDASKKYRKPHVWLCVLYVVACLLSAALMYLGTRDTAPSHWQGWPRRLSWIQQALNRIYDLLNLYPFQAVCLAWLLVAGAIVALLRSRGGDKPRHLAASGVGSLFVLIFLSLVVIPQGWPIVAGAVVGGEFFAIALEPTIGAGPARGTRKFGETLAIAALGMLLPVFFIVVFNSRDPKVNVASITFGSFGLYSDDAAMELSASNLQTLVAAADLQGDTLDICRGPEGTAVVTGLKVWWHGIGTRSHVELPRADGPGVVVDLDTAQAHLIRNHLARCMDLPGTYFESGVGSLTVDGQKELLEAVQRWTQREMRDHRLEQIRIVGHADPMTPTTGTTNHELSQKRAEAVKKALRDSGLLEDFFAQDQAALDKAIHVEGDAARQPLKDCTAQKSNGERRECNEINRRVELRLFFAPQTTHRPTKPAK